MSSTDRNSFQRKRVMIPPELLPVSANLIIDFAEALAEKLYAAQVKYGYEDSWKYGGWEEKCREDLMNHLDKGDPRDVAIYCAFIWYHGWSTARTNPAVREDAQIG